MVSCFSLTLIRLLPNRPSLRVEREKRVSQFADKKFISLITNEQFYEMNFFYFLSFE